MRAWCARIGARVHIDGQRKKKKKKEVRKIQTVKYLCGDFICGQELLLDSLVFLKHFIAIVLGYAQLLFQLNKFVF